MFSRIKFERVFRLIASPTQHHCWCCPPISAPMLEYCWPHLNLTWMDMRSVVCCARAHINNWCRLEQRVKNVAASVFSVVLKNVVCWARLACFSDFNWNLKFGFFCPRGLMSAYVYNPIYCWNVERLIDSLIHGSIGSNADVSLTTDNSLVDFRVHLWSEVSWNLNFLMLELNLLNTAFATGSGD